MDGEKRFFFDRYAIRFIGKPFSTTNSTDAKFRESVHPVQPILPAFRVGVVITSVGYVERKHEERGKYSIEEERVKMRFVIARRSDASIEEMRFSFFSFFSFLTRENNSWFSFYGKIDEAEDFFDG